MYLSLYISHVYVCWENSVGSVKLKTLSVLGPGDSFGIRSFYSSKPEDFHIIANGELTTFAISQKCFLHCVEDPASVLNILERSYQCRVYEMVSSFGAVQLIDVRRILLVSY